MALRFLKKVLPAPVMEMGRAILRRQERGRELKAISLSQAGQDFWVYGEVFNEATGGYFVDLGAHDGIDLSNTFLLESRYGWSGICIEANPVTFQTLRRNRVCKCVNACIDRDRGTVSFASRGMMGGIVATDCDNSTSLKCDTIKVPTTPLAELFRELEVKSSIDYLSVDIEGAEDRALLDFPFKDYRFNCITIERPSRSLRQVFTANEYVLIKEIPGLDCFFVHRSYLPTYGTNLLQFGKKRFTANRWR